MSEAYLLFEVAGATYAILSEQVQWLEMVENVTRVPNAPDFVEGVTIVRGQVIPVVSMRARFRMPRAPVDLRSRLIVIRLSERTIGMLVDTAREFVRIEPHQVIPPPETLTGPVANYIDGVINQPNRLLLLVNLPRLFSAQEQKEVENYQVTNMLLEADRMDEKHSPPEV